MRTVITAKRVVVGISMASMAVILCLFGPIDVSAAEQYSPVKERS